MTMKFKKTISLTLLTCVLTLAGCSDDPTLGYTGKSQYRQDVHTVAIPIWKRGKDVFRRDLEMRITEALIKRIESTTPYKVVSADKADTILTGSLNQVSQATLSHNPDTDVPREISMTMLVDFEWKDQRSGKILRQKKNFAVADVYLPTPPYGQDFLQGSQSVIDKLSERVVETLQKDWD